jgi:hypothetical protein
MDLFMVQGYQKQAKTAIPIFTGFSLKKVFSRLVLGPSIPFRKFGKKLPN